MDDEQRWAEAEQILRGTPDAGVRQGISRRRARFLTISVVALVVLLVAGGVTGWVLAGRDHSVDPEPSPVPTWVSVVGFVVLVLGLIMGAFGLYLAGRGGNWRWKTPESPLTRAQKRSLREQVSLKAPADPAHVSLARDLARRVASQGWLLLVFGGMVVTQLGAAIMTPGPWRFAFVGVLVAFLGLASVLMGREMRRARVFLERVDAQRNR